jgi:hypothetical protein
MLAGLQSQIYSRDPDTGELYLGGWQALKDDWQAMKNERAGKIGENKPPTPRRKGHPGIVDETLSLPTLGTLAPGVSEDSIPDWAFEAADKADLMHKTANHDAGLPPAQGFAQNAAEGVGTMLGQLPIPMARLRALKAAPEIAESAPKLIQGAKKTLGSLPEWFSPTVDPSVANYVSGAGAGGALGAYADYKEEQADAAKSAHRGAQTLVNNYFDKGSMLPGYGEGGKVGALHQVLRAMSMNPHATVKAKSNMLEDPIDNFLYAARQANLSDEEIPPLLAQLKKAQDVGKVDPKLAERLVTMHSKLFTPSAKDIDLYRPPVIPELRYKIAPGVNGYGELPNKPWDELLSTPEK